MAKGQKHPVIKSWPVAGKLPRTGVHIVPHSIMIVNNLSGLGIVDMQGALGLTNDSCQGLVEKILPKLQDFEFMTWAENMRGHW